MNLPMPLSILLQQGISAALQLDPETKQSLSKIDGKVIRVEMTAPAITFHLSIADQNVDVMGQFDAEPDTTITGSANALLSLRSANDALYKGDVKISGDMQTGEKLRHIIEAIDIEPADVLAPITGDTIAHQLGRAGKQFGLWANDAGNSFKRNSSEYLQEEAKLLAPNSEIKRFCSNVEDLNEATERLDARIAQLEKANQHR